MLPPLFLFLFLFLRRQGPSCPASVFPPFLYSTWTWTDTDDTDDTTDGITSFSRLLFSFSFSLGLAHFLSRPRPVPSSICHVPLHLNIIETCASK
jgi:hypothetical protein